MDSEPMSFPKRFGWIGLGAMGYPMAKQLRQNLPSSSSLVIYDIDQDVLHRFAKGSVGSISVTITASAKEVAENSVRS
ncbi:hypothetical protein MPER_05474 [Moniliophthora perniciosa FA553]|nr:hypothetical protein MPER_05474 [Moniliophthora perniciosa FA553]